MVDIEADGPIPGDYSMVCFGAIVVEPSSTKTFYGKLKPASEKWDPEALKVSGFTRDQTLTFDAPKTVMESFDKWIAENSKGRPIFISDNNGFDWMFVCWYFWHFLGENPFGYNSHNLNSLYKGLEKDLYSKFDFLRKRNLTHDALEDAKDNAKIFHELRKKFFKKNA